MFPSLPFVLLLATAQQNSADGSPLVYLLMAIPLALLLAAAFSGREQEPPRFEPFSEPQALVPLTGIPPDEDARSHVTVEIDEVDIVLLRQPPDRS